MNDLSDEYDTLEEAIAATTDETVEEIRGGCDEEIDGYNSPTHGGSETETILGVLVY